MKFGYFTLSDNNYANNPRTPNALVTQIVEEALLAEQLGYHSAWIGEHHFSTLGVNSAPQMVLSYIAAQTKHIRLAPAINVLPLHHPIHVAEQWATLDLLSGGRVDFATGRGYDRREYAPFGANFEKNSEVFAEGLSILKKLWADGSIVSHHGTYYNFDNVWITPMPVQKPLPVYVAAFSHPTIELAARNGCGLVVAAGAASAMHGSLANVANLFGEECAKAGHPRGRMISSYFIHFADTPQEEQSARERQLRYHKECTSPAFPGDPKTAPENYRYFEKIVQRYQTQQPQDFKANSVLIGNAQHMIDTLKEKVEAAGFAEVILYFNLGLKDKARVREEMTRFMQEVAPAFAAPVAKAASFGLAQ